MSVLDGLIGAMLVAVVLSSILFGVMTVQTHSYFTRFPNDPQWVKTMVLILWIVDCAHQVCACMAVYNYTVTHFTDPANLVRDLQSLGMTVTLEPISAFIVQLYFCRRLYRLNPKWWPVALVAVALAVIAYGTGEACGIIIHFLPFLADFKKYTWLVTLWLSASCLCDIVIAVAISSQLWNSKSGFKRTDQLLTKLTLWTVNTGMLPATVAIIDIITFITLSDSLVHLAANIILAKLYTNSTLAFLNRRTSDLDHSFSRSGSNPNLMNMAKFSTTSKSGNTRSRFGGRSAKQWQNGSVGDSCVPVTVEVSRKTFHDNDISHEHLPSETLSLSPSMKKRSLEPVANTAEYREPDYYPTHEPDVIEMMHFPLPGGGTDRNIGAIPFSGHERARGAMGVTLEIDIRGNGDAESISSEFEGKRGY